MSMLSDFTVAVIDGEYPPGAEGMFWYTKFVIKDRWPEAEPVIMKDPKWALRYARDVIKGRWYEAEPYVMKDPKWAQYYAMDVIKGRWPEAEPVIMKHPKWAKRYKDAFNI